jgi:hypothetical protein
MFYTYLLNLHPFFAYVIIPFFPLPNNLMYPLLVFEIRTAPAQDLAVSGARSDAQTLLVSLIICNVGV